MKKRMLNSKALLTASLVGLGLPAFVSTASAQEVTAYKTGGSSYAILNMTSPLLGLRTVSLTVSANSIEDCAKMFAAKGMWDFICEKVAKDAQGPQIFKGVFEKRKGPLVMGGRLSNASRGFRFEAEVSMNSDFEAVKVTTTNDENGEIGTVSFDGRVGDVEAVKNGIPALSARLNGSVIKSEISLGAVDYDGNRTARLTFSYANRSKDCAVDLPEGAGWTRLCENAYKDGDRVLTGTLNPIPDQINAFAGRLEAADTGFALNAVVSQARAGYGIVSVKRTGGTFNRSVSSVDNVIYDSSSSAPPAPPPAPTSSVIDLSKHDWRVAHESIPELGAEIELSFQKLSSTLEGFTGSMSVWFPPNPSAYCPSTPAMLAICESASKDGALPFIVGIDKDNFIKGTGYQGAASVRPGSGVNWQPFSIDVFEGRAIQGWSDAEPNAIYLRITKLGNTPAGGATGWLKLEPLTRAMRTVDGNRKISALEADPAPPSPKTQPSSTTKAGFKMDSKTARICGPELEAAYRYAKSKDGSHIRMTNADWQRLIDKTYRTTRQQIDAYNEKKTYYLDKHCINKIGLLRSWADNARYVEVNQLKEKDPKKSEKVTSKCELMSNQLAKLKSSNGLRSDGSVAENWQQQVRFVEQFLKALPPDYSGNGQSCEKGLDVISGTLAKLGIDPNPTNQGPSERDKPNGATFCEALASTYSQIGSAAEQNRAREVLLNDGRTKTWKLPTSETMCEIAGQVLAENRIKGF